MYFGFKTSNGSSIFLFGTKFNFLWTVWNILPRKGFLYLLKQGEWISLLFLFKNIPVFRSCTAGGSRVALPHIYLQRYYPSRPQNQLSVLIYKLEATWYRMKPVLWHGEQQTDQLYPHEKKDQGCPPQHQPDQDRVLYGTPLAAKEPERLKLF